MVVQFNRSIYIILQSNLIDYFTICFKHNAYILKNSLMYGGMVVLEIGVVLLRTFVSTLFANITQKSQELQRFNTRFQIHEKNSIQIIYSKNIYDF